MIKEIDELLKELCKNKKLKLVFAQPYEHNVVADGKNKMYVWSDIQQSGNITPSQYSSPKLSATIKLNFCDGMRFQEEGIFANDRKNEVLDVALKFHNEFEKEGIKRGLFVIEQATSWQVLYNADDENQIIVKLNINVTEYKDEC